MKRSRNFLATIYTVAVIFLPQLMLAQFTNGYFHNASDDKIALAPKLDASGYVQSSTSDQAGNKDVHLMKFDAVGNVMADVTIATATNDEYATGIVRGNGNTYVVCGYERVGLLDIGFVMSVDTNFNVLNKVYINVAASNRHTPALNVINSAFYDKPTFGQYWPGDSNGGYLITGFEAVGYNPTDSKSGYALKLSNSLAVQWVRIFDSPIVPGTTDWDMANSAGWIWTGAFGYFIGGSGTAPSGEQAGFAARLDLSGNVVWQEIYSDNNVAGTWCLATDCAYDDAEMEVYQLANYSQTQSGGIVAFNENTGAINSGRTRYLVSTLVDYYNYEFAATCAGAEVIISGYGLNQTSGSITGTFPYAIRYNKNFPMVDVSWQHYAYPRQSSNYNPSTSIFDTYSTSEQPRIYYPKMFASRQVNYLAMSGFEDNAALDEIHVIEPYFDGKDSCEYIDPQIVAVPLNTFIDVVNSVFVTYNVTPVTTIPTPQTPTTAPCFDCAIDTDFTFTTGTNCCYTFTANQANFCPTWNIYDVSNNVVATGTGITLTYCFLTNGTYTVEYCDCGLTIMGIICRQCSQQTIVVNCPSTCTPSNSDYSYVVNGCTVTFTDLTPDGDPDGCEYWVMGNLGTVNAVDFLTYTFPGSGTYNVCHYDCCRLNAASPPIYTVTCYQITVNCTPPCCLPTDFNVTGNGCCRTFTPVYPVGCTSFPFYFYWNFGDGNTSTAPNPTHCYNGNGIYTVCLTVYCGKMNYTTICKRVKVKFCAWPPPPPCCTGTSKIAYTNSGVYVTATGFTVVPATTAVVGYAWDWGDGTSSTGTDASHYYLQGGTYTITLTTTLESGGQVGTITSTETLTVQPTPACNCTPRPPAAFAGIPNVCDENGITNLRILMTDEPADISYQWQKLNSGGLFEDIPGVVGQVAWLSGVSETTIYRCRATWNETGAVAYSNDVLVTYGYFTATVTASPPNVCSGVSSTLDVVAPDAINYDWTPNSATTSSTSVSPTTSTTYGVLMENAAGCGQSATVQVVVDPCSAPSNNDFANAVLAPSTGSAYPAGNCYSGTLQFASVSPEGNPLNVASTGGQDAWYAFTALSSASRVVCTTNAMDVVLELHDSGGTEIDMENAVSNTTQGEIMITTGLTPGQIYYVAVRSFNGVTGPYTVCLQSLSFSGCSDGSGTYDLCTNFKAAWSGANSYTFNFFPTGVTPGSPTSATATSQIALSNPALALRHGGTYDVRVDGNFVFVDAGGNNENITLQGTVLCQIVIAPHADLRTKFAQRCPATVLKGTWLQAKPFVCAAVNHTIEFQEVSDCTGSTVIGPLFTTTTSGSSSTKWLQQVAGIQSGKWYTVRWRPNFAYGPGNYGTLDVIRVGGSSSSESEQNDSAIVVDENEAQSALYPNPNDGNAVFINLTDLQVDLVGIAVFDGLGRVVFQQQYAADGSLNALIQFNQTLSSGIYLVEIRLGEEIITEKMIVD
jgi:PKD repeat protein